MNRVAVSSKSGLLSCHVSNCDMMSHEPLRIPLELLEESF